MEKIWKIKFTELFIIQKYEQITQESLAKIEDLTIKDLSGIPKAEEIEGFKKNKGITNLKDLSLLAKLIEDGIHIVNTIAERISLKKDMIQTICDAFADSSNFFPKRTPPSLLDLCKTNIIKSSLTEQISCPAGLVVYLKNFGIWRKYSLMFYHNVFVKIFHLKMMAFQIVNKPKLV